MVYSSVRDAKIVSGLLLATLPSAATTTGSATGSAAARSASGRATALASASADSRSTGFIKFLVFKISIAAPVNSVHEICGC